MEFLKEPPARPPRWLGAGLLPHLESQAERLGQVHQQLQAHRDMVKHSKGVGVEREVTREDSNMPHLPQGF